MINIINRIRSLFISKPAPQPPITYELNITQLESLSDSMPKNGDTVRLVDKQYGIDIQCIYQDGELLPKGCE